VRASGPGAEPGRLGAAARSLASGPLLVVAAICLLGAAWIVANPPGYTPDEPAHFVKAVGVGEGEWAGRPGAYGIGPGFGPLQLQWINRAARVFHVPDRIAPDWFACSLFQPHQSAGCLSHRASNRGGSRLTYVGTYEPFLYYPAGFVMNRATSAHEALIFGRAVNGGIALALMSAAAFVLWRPGEKGLPLLGLVGAVSPMVIFVASGLAPSGPELGAAVCVVAVVCRLSRPGPASPGVWLVLGAAGAVLALSRSLGPFFLLAHAALLVLLLGPRQVFLTLRSGRWWSAAALAAIVAGVAANAAWGLVVQPHPPLDVGAVLGWIPHSLGDLREVLRQDVGSFGWADVNMPKAAYAAWTALELVLVAAAFVVGSRRQRLVLAAVIGGCLAATVMIDAAVIHPTHFPMYGRYALPLLVAVPLVAGETVRANHVRVRAIWARVLAGGVMTVAASVQLVGFYANARRYAVSNDGPVWFLGRSQWSPPGGWGPWVATAVLAALALVAHAIVASRHDPSLAHEPSPAVSPRLPEPVT